VTSARLPALFLGHGSPLNAIRENAWTHAWQRLGRELPRPRGILAISAHWYVPGTAVTAMARPRTIHDFGGFPRELYAARYDAPGDAALAEHVAAALAPLPVALDQTWGLDHGTWAVLCHVYPQADIPVLQLSMDARKPPRFHYELGTRLRGLREQGILILGSGDIVHNLREFARDDGAQAPYDWALRFESLVRSHLESGDHDPLIEYTTLGADALRSVPTPEHYLPLLYVMGASLPGERVSFPVEGMDGGSVSMLAVKFGND
jgi:4,5-DOPA dioxygenase extradiol